MLRKSPDIAQFALGVSLACLIAGSTNASATPPPFDSTSGTVFDIVQATDPTTFLCLEDRERDQRQIWDKRVDGEPIVDAFLFNARYSDGTAIEIAVNPEFETLDAARDEALRYAAPLGQLPTLLREGIERFSIHDGQEGFHAGTGQIVVYAETADNKLGYDHLEESLFHESVHASLDDAHRLAPDWIEAQNKDGAFMTRYAESSPEREDLAETALFAFAILHHPDRLPPVDTQDTLRVAQHRIDYIANLLSPDQPLTYQVAPVSDCSD